MTSNVELLPCPFCGSENIDAQGWASTDSAGPACDDCGASAGGVKGTLQDNITAWNTRANVIHHTAPLRYALDNAARDIKTLREVRDAQAADIERLRAERDVICAQALKYANESGRLEAKVDRLADELRKITELRERHHDNLHDAVTIAGEALRDSAAGSA